MGSVHSDPARQRRHLRFRSIAAACFRHPAAALRVPRLGGRVRRGLRQDPDRPRRAGVSSFGISGTNAHIILEQAPDATVFDSDSPAVEDDSATGRVLPWVLSARSEPALRETAARLTAQVEADPARNPVDVGWSLVSSRARLEHRAVIAGTDRTELVAALSALAAGRSHPSVVAGVVRPGKTAFVFPGQGAQWIGMGRELAQEFPVFATAFDEVTDLLHTELGFSVRAVIWPVDYDVSVDQHEAVNSTLFAQTGLFAVGVATARLLESFGVTPDVVAGHSIGEIVAAHVAGILSLPDAVTLVAARARLMQALPTRGAMAALTASEAEIRAVLEVDAGLGSVGIAAANGARSVVVSGPREQIEAVVARSRIAAEGVRWLRVSHAFHSPLMEPMLAEFARALDGIRWHEPSIPIVSNVTGVLADSSMLSPHYWVSHVRECVRFADGIQSLHEAGVSRYVVAGPDGGLTALISDILDDARGAMDSITAAADVVAVLARTRSERACLLIALATVDVTAGAAGGVSWLRLWDGTARRRLTLPSYAFQRRHYWREADRSGDVDALGVAGSQHPLIGAVVAVPETGGVIVSGRLSAAFQPWLADHAVSGAVLLPGTGFVELVMRGADEVGCGQLRELTLVAPLVLPKPVQVRVAIGGAGEYGERSISVHSRPESVRTDHVSEWTLHAEGVVAPSSPRRI
ncbi:acyltransferase domain-containing protein, partial [Nocardia sp. NPDC058497]|uniref:acyltransferase domain-containing protein n=1 Tax=Nocardia sp. NPDC058497 TaxID=3346529 RepID=UPI00365E8BF3